MKRLFLDPYQKICAHLDFLFGKETSIVLPEQLEIEYSRKTGKIKNFNIDKRLIGTFRTDGGVALTIEGARLFIQNRNFLNNCIVPVEEAIPFVSEGRSLFVKHVLKCGKNIRNGSEVVVIDGKENVLAVGRSLFHCSYYSSNYSSLNSNRDNIRGVGVKIREGIKSRTA